MIWRGTPKSQSLGQFTKLFDTQWMNVGQTHRLWWLVFGRETLGSFQCHEDRVRDDDDVHERRSQTTHTQGHTPVQCSSGSNEICSRCCATEFPPQVVYRVYLQDVKVSFIYLHVDAESRLQRGVEMMNYSQICSCSYRCGFIRRVHFLFTCTDLLCY